MSRVAMWQISLASAPGLCLRQHWQKQMSRAALILHHLHWWSWQLVIWENLKFVTADNLLINPIYPVSGDFFHFDSRREFGLCFCAFSMLFCVIEWEGYAKTTAMSERVLEAGDLFLDIFYLCARATPATRIVHLCVSFLPTKAVAIRKRTRQPEHKHICREIFACLSLQRHEINGPFTAGWFCVCESASTFIGSFRFIMPSPRRSLALSSYFWMPPHRLGGIKSPEDYIAALLFGRAADICVNSMLSPPGRWGLLSS